MAIITINSVPAKIVEAEAVPVPNILQITTPDQKPTAEREYTIEVKQGTYQFAAGVAVSAENPILIVGDKFIITLSEKHKLNFLSSAINAEFHIST